MYGISSYGTKPYGTVYLDEQETATPALASSVSLTGSVTSQVSTNAVIVPVNVQTLQGSVTTSVTDTATIIPIDTNILAGSVSGTSATESANLATINILVREARPIAIAILAKVSSSPLEASFTTSSTVQGVTTPVNIISTTGSEATGSSTDIATITSVNIFSLQGNVSIPAISETANLVSVKIKSLSSSFITSATDTVNLVPISAKVEDGVFTTSSTTQGTITPVNIISTTGSEITASSDTAIIVPVNGLSLQGSISLPAILETAKLVGINAKSLSGSLGTSATDTANLVPITVKTEDGRFTYQGRVVCFGSGANNILLVQTGNTIEMLTEENKLGCDT